MNKSVFELRVEISKRLKCTWEEVKLLLNNVEIKDNENGKTVGDIRLKTGQYLTVQKRPTPPIQEAELLIDNKFTTQADRVFRDLFAKYSKDGKMNQEDLASFVSATTGETVTANDNRVKSTMQQHDTDKDGFLTTENFIDFYLAAAKDKKSVVWQNLKSHHIRPDLRRPEDIEIEKLDVTKLPRFILTHNEKFFELLMSLLDLKGKIAGEAWKLLSRLPVSPKLYEKIVLLE